MTKKPSAIAEGFLHKRRLLEFVELVDLMVGSVQ